MDVVGWQHDTIAVVRLTLLRIAPQRDRWKPSGVAKVRRRYLINRNRIFETSESWIDRG